MELKKVLSSIPVVRPIVIQALRMFERNITVANSYSGHALRINTYRHKGYWYFNREREKDTMHFFSRLIRAGDTVIEVGGHIGFITQYFSKLVGEAGHVVVFEPGLNNIPYIEQNVGCLKNVVLERVACSSENGKATFYEDNVTGQNNSLLSDYRGAELAAMWHYQALARTPRQVDLVTLDTYTTDHSLAPDFLKIDVEGCELDVLLGARKILRHVRSLMVEVTYHHEAVADILRDAGFDIFDESGKKLDRISFVGNVFAVRRA